MPLKSKDMIEISGQWFSVATNRNYYYLFSHHEEQECLSVTIGSIWNSKHLDIVRLFVQKPIYATVTGDNVVTLVLRNMNVDTIVDISILDSPETIRSVELKADEYNCLIHNYASEQQTITFSKSPEYLITPHVRYAYWYSIEPLRVNFFTYAFMDSKFQSYSINISVPCSLRPTMQQYSSAFCLVLYKNNNESLMTIDVEGNVYTRGQSVSIPVDGNIVAVATVSEQEELKSYQSQLCSYDHLPPKTTKLGWIRRPMIPRVEKMNVDTIAIQINKTNCAQKTFVIEGSFLSMYTKGNPRILIVETDEKVCIFSLCPQSSFFPQVAWPNTRKGGPNGLRCS